MENPGKLHSRYMKEHNRICALTEKYRLALIERKAQLTKWNMFFAKLIQEGRITKEELRQYSPRKIKK